MIDLDSVDLSKLEARMVTDKGEMKIGFYPEQAPGHVKNFAKLAQDGFKGSVWSTHPAHPTITRIAP